MISNNLSHKNTPRISLNFSPSSFLLPAITIESVALTIQIVLIGY